jgi:hypothetical protein
VGDHHDANTLGHMPPHHQQPLPPSLTTRTEPSPLIVSPLFQPPTTKSTTDVMGMDMIASDPPPRVNRISLRFRTLEPAQYYLWVDEQCNIGQLNN